MERDTCGGEGFTTRPAAGTQTAQAAGIGAAIPGKKAVIHGNSLVNHN